MKCHSGPRTDTKELIIWTENCCTQCCWGFLPWFSDWNWNHRFVGKTRRNWEISCPTVSTVLTDAMVLNLFKYIVFIV